MSDGCDQHIIVMQTVHDHMIEGGENNVKRGAKSLTYRGQNPNVCCPSIQTVKQNLQKIHWKIILRIISRSVHSRDANEVKSLRTIYGYQQLKFRQG